MSFYLLCLFNIGNIGGNFACIVF